MVPTLALIPISVLALLLLTVPLPIRFTICNWLSGPIVQIRALGTRNLKRIRGHLVTQEAVIVM